MVSRPNARAAFLRSQARHYQQCWKEAKIVGVIWMSAFIYCSTVLARMGYVPPEQRPRVPSMIWGVPTWVFWGLFVPWIVLILVTWFFAVFVLKDDEPFMELPESSSGRVDDAAS